MLPLTKPTIDPSDLFLRCVDTYMDQSLKDRLRSIAPEVGAAAKAYDIAARSVALHTVQTSTHVAGVVTAAEMIAVYTNKMSKASTPGRREYDELLALPRLGICPLCAHRVVSTLDHHLPKAQYPVLAVTPFNLIPACFDCNRAKLSTGPTSTVEETFHPYYDDVSQERWLTATVVEDVPPALTFAVAPPSTWDATKTARAKHHLKTFKLSKLYSSHAGQELINQRLAFISEFGRDGADGVRVFLEEQARSREAANLNSWQAATYRALAQSLWFSQEGHARIPASIKIAPET